MRESKGGVGLLLPSERASEATDARPKGRRRGPAVSLSGQRHPPPCFQLSR